MVTFLEIGRKAFLFTFIVDLMDTAVMMIFIAAGVPVPSFLAFVPPSLLQATVAFVDFVRNIYVSNIFISILALAFIGPLLAFFDFLVMMMGGWIVFAINVSMYVKTYIPWLSPLATAIDAACVLLEVATWWYVITQLSNYKAGPI